jgi:hypothetical protein
MARGTRHGRGAMALGIYLVLAVVFFATGLNVLGWVAAAAAVLAAADLLWVARGGERHS